MTSRNLVKKQLQYTPRKHMFWWRYTEDFLKMSCIPLQCNMFLSSKTSSRRNCKTSSWRHVEEDVLQTPLEDVLKTFWKRLAKTSWRSLEEDILQTRLENVLKKTYCKHVLKTSCNNVLKRSWRRHLANTSWRRLGRRLQDVFKTSWIRLAKKFEDDFGRRLERGKIVSLKASSRHLEDVLENKNCLLRMLPNIS